MIWEPPRLSRQDGANQEQMRETEKPGLSSLSFLKGQNETQVPLRHKPNSQTLKRKGSMIHRRLIGRPLTKKSQKHCKHYWPPQPCYRTLLQLISSGCTQHLRTSFGKNRLSPHVTTAQTPWKTTVTQKTCWSMWRQYLVWGPQIG